MSSTSPPSDASHLNISALFFPQSAPMAIYSDDWQKVEDPVERRRAQNRIAQRICRGVRKTRPNSAGAVEGKCYSTLTETLILPICHPLPATTTPPGVIDTEMTEMKLFSTTLFHPPPTQHAGQGSVPQRQYPLPPSQVGYTSSLLAATDIGASVLSPSSTTCSNVLVPWETKLQQGNTPLHQAVLQENEDMVGLLLDYGSSIAAQNADGMTPLHLAAQQGYKRILKKLLDGVSESGSELNILDNGGLTALHCAVLSNHPHIAKMLLDAGADANAAWFWRAGVGMDVGFGMPALK